MSHEIAVSVNFKYVPGSGEVRDARDGHVLPLGDLDTKIIIYEDRVRGWFFHHADRLIVDGNADYVVLQICLAQVEGMEQFRRGASSDGRSRDFFIRAVRRIFGIEHQDSELGDLYVAVRCGLFHDGFTKGVVLVSRSYEKPLETRGGAVYVNAKMFLAKVKGDFASYVTELRGNNAKLRRDFERMWDERWRAAKSPLTKGTPVWPSASKST